MRKASVKVLSLLLVLVTLASMIVPTVVLAAESAFETAAEENAPEYLFRKTFSDGKANTGGSQAACVADGGYFLSVANGSTYTLDNDSLKFTSIAPKDYMDVRFYYDATRKDCRQDFILSFWIKPDTDDLKITTWTWKEYTTDVQENGVFKIMGGNYQIAGKDYPNAHLAKDKWSLVEIVFNYDEDATSVDGKQGATTSYTFLLNGEEIATAPATYYFNNIDRYRFFQWAYATYEIDDLTYALGNKSLIGTPRTGLPSEENDGDFVYREEFDKGYINVQNTQSAVSGANGFWQNLTNGSTYEIVDETLHYTSMASKDYIDLRYYLDKTKHDLTEDFTFSFWLKPDIDQFGMQLSWEKHSGSGSDNTVLKLTKGYMTIGGKAYTDAKIPKDVWSHIEIVALFDDDAIADTGETGAVTSYIIRLNGQDIATVEATKLFNNIDHFRVFQWANGTYSLDDITIALGTETTYTLGRSKVTVPEASETLYTQDFSAGSINTSDATADIIAANGFIQTVDNGTKYTVKDGYLEYTDKYYKDFIGLQFYHDGTKLDLNEDFVLSYKLKANQATSYKMYFTNHSYGKFDTGLALRYNRFSCVDDLNSSGKDNIDVVLKANVWSQIELVFHYEETATAVTGEKGAFPFYSIYLNGEYVQTVKTMYDFHTIDEFKFFTHGDTEFAIDDIIIATGNTTLVTNGSGWDKKTYFFDKDPITDYDYSICILGDIQSLTAWNQTGLNTLYDWVAANAADKKMAVVLGLGDLTQYSDDYEYERVTEAIAKLNGVVPYTMVRGNHDTPEDFNNYVYFNEGYRNQIEIAGGFFGENDAQCFWRKVDAGTDKYLVIGLDFGPTDAELDWAASIIEAYPDRRVIITTHGYLASDGTLLDKNDWSAPTVSYGEPNDADAIWERLGAKYENVKFIIGGHIGTDYIVMNQAEGANGNTVTQLLVNPQFVDHLIEGGVGMVAMMYFKNGEMNVGFETYSAVQEKYFLAENQFTFSLDGETVVQDPTVIFSQTFDSGSVNTSGNESGCKPSGGFFLGDSTNSVYNLDNNTLKYTTLATKTYIDIRFYYESTAQDLTQDFILSFWIKPDTDNLKITTWTWKEYSTSVQENGIFKIMDGYYQINGVNYKNARLEKDKWALVEIVYNYDENATSVDGKQGAVTSYTFLLNGEEIATAPATYFFNNIDRWRMMQFGYSTYELDDLKIALGNESLIHTVSKAPSVKTPVAEPEEKQEILFHEDFSDAINTKGTEAASTAANGFFASIGANSIYNLDNGTMNYIRRTSGDYIDIRFNYAGTAQNLARDFILSFKIKTPRTGLSMQFAWTDKSHGTYENTFEIEGGRFRSNGTTNPDAVLKADVWQLIEIAFHFDPNATAITGEKGAITAYTVMLNGKAVYTANTTIAFNNIDNFRIFRYCNSEYELDDLIVATTNNSLDVNDEFVDWEKKVYYVEKEPVTDYDYSFVIVGDTQKVNRHYPSKMATIYDWIVNNVESKNIKFVFGLGDITDTDSTKEWETAREAIFKMNGVVPYSLIRGNHDGSEGINTYFYVDEYTNQFMGFFGEGSMENSWTLLDAGSDKYLLLTLDFGPTDAELDWAADIIEAYPDRKVIITTHTYLKPDKSLVDPYYSHAPSGYDETSKDGVDIWERLGNKYENVFMIISGHISSDEIITNYRVGENGNVVTELLVDPQTVDGVLGGTGMVTILYFTEGGVTVQVETYSTIKEQYFLEENQFNIDISAWEGFGVCEHIYDNEYDADCNNCGEIREVEIPVTVVANGTCGVNTTWVLTSDGVLTISGNGDTEDYLVNITKDQPYRAYASQITKVVFEEGVTSIGRGVFYGFTNITEVVFPESLIAIHEYAFFGCTAIKTIDVPANTFYIGMYAFRKTGLTSINFANAEGWKFADGTALDITNVKAFTTEFTYKQTCMRPVYEDGEVIANGVFGNKEQFTWTLTSTGLLTVSGTGNMPKFNVNTTPWYGYRGAIRSVVIEEGITSVGRCSFHTCRAITSVTLPESIETIAEYAFYNCQFLTEATIPANVTRIEIYAFRKCFQLKNVTFAINYGWSANGEKISATEINSNAADMLTLVNYTKIWTRDVNAEEEVLDPNYVTGGACNTTVKWALTYVDDTKTKMKLTISGTGAMPKFETAGTPWYAYLNDIVEVEVCEGITEIGRCSFYGLKFVKEVTISNTVIAINDYAFNGCFSLKSITIPESVTFIADTAFTKTGLSEIPKV